ncbi:hypothetical protein BAY1663_02417 [Pseudomonas sp. BAY1663]|nr:hypothetical protein BAY1663_02417 [Pseudomonas sp. BAY1663]
MALVGHGLFGTLCLAGHRADQPGELGSGAGDLLYQRMDLLDETVERAGQLAQLVLAGDRQALGQVAVALGHVVEVVLDPQQRTQDGVAEQHGEAGHDQQQQQRGAEHDHGQAVDALLEDHAGRLHIALDVVQVQRGAERQAPLRQVLGITDLGHQRVAAGHGEAVVDEMAAVLPRLDQLADRVDALGVAEVGEAFADPLTAIALEHAHRPVVIAPEITLASIGQALENPHRLVAGLPVVGCGALVDGGNRVACQFDVVRELRAPVLDQACPCLRFLLVGQVLQLDDRNAAEHDGQQENRPESKQQQLHAQT